MNPTRLRTYINLLIVSIIWGFAGVVIKFTLGGFSPVIFLTYRLFIAGIAALIFFAITGFKLPRDRKGVLMLVVYGFFMSTVSLGLLFLGTDKTTSIDANLISAVAPITTVIAGAILLKEHVTRRERIGLIIAFVGTIITVLEPILRFEDGFSGLEGNLLVLASVIVGTLTAVLAKFILRDDVKPAAVTNYAFLIGFLTTLPIALIGNSPKHIITSIMSTPLQYHLGVFYMALISGTLAYTLWHKAEKTIEVSEVSLFAYLYPVFGTPLSVLWLGEKITLPFVIGALVIAFGVILAEYKKPSAAAVS